jgi:F-type H+-transporting ATPase subunit epsilon
MAQLNCQVVTPERAALDTTVDFVALTLEDGELGVAPGRSPLIARLGSGELRLRSSNSVSRYYLEGGFVQVLDDVVTVLTNRAVPAESIDLEATRLQLERALRQRAHSLESIEKREQAVQLARAQLRVAEHAGGK